MKLSFALAAAGAVLAVVSSPLRADEGLPLPADHRAAIAVLESRVERIDRAEARLEQAEAKLVAEVKLLRSKGFNGILDGRRERSIYEIIWQFEYGPRVRALETRIAAIVSREAALQHREALARQGIDERKAAIVAEEQARIAAEQARIAEEQARAERASLDGRIEKAIETAKNAWRDDGIVNRNTGDHSWDGWCLALASMSWAEALGHDFEPIRRRSAYQAYLACRDAGLVRTEGDPPRGALVFWPAGPSGFGHVAISNGDGTVVSNYNRRVSPTGINEAAQISAFGTPIGWVHPADIK